MHGQAARSHYHRIMSRITALGALLAAVSLHAAAPAQEPQTPVFTTGARTVAVFATVTSAGGRLVTDLERGDFTIEDEGKRQTLTVFSNDVQPITIVMLLDR